MARAAGGLNTDVNGDGYADLLVSAPMSSVGAPQAGQAYVYLGGPSLPTTPAVTIGSDLTGDVVGSSVAMIGDVNGDGFGDFLIRTEGDLETAGRAPTPRVLIFFGGPALHNSPDVTLPGGVVGDENAAAAGIGDINGDGYDDFAFAGSDADAGHNAFPPTRVEIHFGGPTLSSTADLTLLDTNLMDFFGSSIASGGDVNGDGLPDLIVGSHEASNAARIYFGGPAMHDVPDVTLVSPAGDASGDLFGFSVAMAGDVNGDGYDDVLVGAPSTDATSGLPGRAYLYFGGPAMHATPDVTFASTVEAEWFGIIVAPAGDVDGDGFADIAVVVRGVAPMDGRTATNGRVEIYRGGPTPSSSPMLTLSGGPGAPEPRGFAAMDFDGDSLPDFVVGRWVSDYRGVGQAVIFRSQDDYVAPAVTLSGTAGDWFGTEIAR